MPPKPLSAEYFDGWYADQAVMPAVAEIMNRHVGFPPGARAGLVPAEAIPELAEELRLRPGSTLLDLACGRGAYGLLVAKQAGTLLRGDLKPGGRVALTCWEPFDRADERLSPRLRRANLAAGLPPGGLHGRRGPGPPVLAGTRARAVGRGRRARPWRRPRAAVPP
jgi:hypothetical protein